MSDGNNPVEGTASLSADEADSAIANILFGDAETVDETVEPSNEEEEIEEVHPETDTTEEETSNEDVESEEIAAPSWSDDTEIEVNGERIKVSDLKSGYLRQSDYTKKTQELAQHRQQVQDHLRTEYGNYLRAIEQNLVDHFPKEPDWMELAQDNPAEYAVQRELWAKRHNDLNGVRQLRAQQEQYAEAQFAQAKAQAQTKAYEDLVQMHPEFAQTAEGQISQVGSELLGFALNEVGLPEQLIQQIDDARVFSLLYDAMRYRRGEAQKSKALAAVADKPKLARPGVTQSKTSTAQAEVAKQMARLKRTGRSEDADALISGILFGKS